MPNLAMEIKPLPILEVHFRTMFNHAVVELQKSFLFQLQLMTQDLGRISRWCSKDRFDDESRVFVVRFHVTTLQMQPVAADTNFMTRHCVFWKPIICQDVRDQDFASDLADIISDRYRGALLSEILNMPRKIEISLERAAQILLKLQAQAQKEKDFKKYHWYFDNFVKVISDSGHHIELTGDEFEVILRSSRAC